MVLEYSEFRKYIKIDSLYPRFIIKKMLFIVTFKQSSIP